jgi:pimeloyl-ACP methyl ester carboxylesterase
MKWLAKIVIALIIVVIALFLIFRTPDTNAAEMRAKYGDAPSQFVDLGGGLIVHLRDEGAKDAPAIILLHGSNADLHTWEPWAEALKSQYRVIRFDQVGHGLTGPDPDDNYSRDNYVDHIRRVADALNVETFVLGGNSMGGKHALAFAVAHPERLSGLVLVDASGMPMSAGEPAQTEDAEKDEKRSSGNIGFKIASMPGVNKIAEQVTPRSLIEQSLRQSVSVEAIVTEDMIDRYWELLRYPGNRRATMARFSMDYDPLEQADIAKVNVPALIIWGEEDRLIPVSAARWLDRVMPQTTLAIYPKIGHLPQEEAVEASLADLTKWLTALNLAKPAQ